MPGAHSFLSASSAARWMACPPSARFSQFFPREDTAYSQEGTTAHALAQKRILEECEKRGLPAFSEDAPTIDPDSVDAEMRDYVDDYADYVVGCMYEMDDLEGVYLEQRVSLGAVIPGGFGTADVIIVGNRELCVIDLKYGLGTPVSAVHNPQLMLYALGALTALHDADIDRVVLRVAQPRRYSYTEFSLRPDELVSWGADTARPAAIEAFQGSGQFHPGEHCAYCPAKDHCRARAALEADIAGAIALRAAELTDEQLGALPPILGYLRKTAGELEEYALSRAEAGVTFPGYELKKRKARRTITDPDGAAAALRDAGFTPDQYMKEPELRTQTSLRQMMGPKAFERVLGKFVGVPEGGGKSALSESRDFEKKPLTEFVEAFRATLS